MGAWGLVVPVSRFECCSNFNIAIIKQQIVSLSVAIKIRQKVLYVLKAAFHQKDQV